MKKHEEYKLKFYKKPEGSNKVFNGIDAEQAVGGDRNLAFICFLQSILIDNLLSLIADAQNNSSVDVDSLSCQEEYVTFQLEFNPPYFSIDGGVRIIHMDDFKELLLEWKEFCLS